MRDTKASLPPTRFPAAGNVLLIVAESLNENDLWRDPLLFSIADHIKTNRRMRRCVIHRSASIRIRTIGTHVDVLEGNSSGER